MGSILTMQKYAIKNLIEGMTVASGYNNNWSVVNQLNQAIGSFPRAEVYRPKEDNKDSKTGVGDHSYTNVVTYKIVVDGEINFISQNPVFDIEEVFSDALVDLKQLFGQNPQLPINIAGVVTGSCDSILYRGYEHEYESTNQFVPTRLITKWEVTYSQDRTQPNLFAGS